MGTFLSPIQFSVFFLSAEWVAQSLSDSVVSKSNMETSGVALCGKQIVKAYG